MTTSQARGIKQDALNVVSVAEYLQTYPDFFERNGPLLTKLRLPHLRDSGATVSLVERQVEVLRERNQSLERKLKEAERLSGEAMPHELVLRLKHMIVSHHGQYEFGSPKLPMTLEAIALHHLDNLDAKIHAFSREIRDDPSRDSNWTPFKQSLGRRLYKGLPATDHPNGDGLGA